MSFSFTSRKNKVDSVIWIFKCRFSCGLAGSFFDFLGECSRNVRFGSVEKIDESHARIFASEFFGAFKGDFR